MGDGLCKRLPYGWTTHPDFDNCRSVGSFKPALEVDMSLPGVRVVRVLERLRLQGRLPERIKVDNGPEFSGNALNTWLGRFTRLRVRSERFSSW